MSQPTESTEWRWQYGVRIDSPKGRKYNWAPMNTSHSTINDGVDLFNAKALAVGAESVSRATLVRRKAWTKTTTWSEPPEEVTN
jgi:hypothetical protein